MRLNGVKGERPAFFKQELFVSDLHSGAPSQAVDKLFPRMGIDPCLAVDFHKALVQDTAGQFSVQETGEEGLESKTPQAQAFHGVILVGWVRDSAVLLIGRFLARDRPVSGLRMMLDAKIALLLIPEQKVRKDSQGTSDLMKGLQSTGLSALQSHDCLSGKPRSVRYFGGRQPEAQTAIPYAAANSCKIDASHIQR